MSIQRLSRNALASMTLVIGSTLLMIELYRFLVRTLGPAQLGVWSLVVASTAAARLGEMGVGNAVMKLVASDLGDREPSRAAATLGICLAVVAVLVAVLCVLLWPLMYPGLAVVISDPELLNSARALLPWALASLWFGAIGQVQLCALDALQRTDLKMFATLGAGAGQLAAAYALVPTYGLPSLGPVQLVHAVLTLTAATVVVVFALKVPARSWMAWTRTRLSQTLRYGFGVQAASLGQLLFEPAVKALLAVQGGPALTGYFELANRAVTQCRMLIVSVCQMLIPYLSYHSGSQAPAAARTVRVYRAVHSVLFVFTVPYFALLAAALPLVLSLWLGRFDLAFVGIGLACTLGWGLNTLVVSAYTVYMALGTLRWTVWAQIAIGALNAVLASIGGYLWGGAGVLAGAMLALALGSALITIAFHREFDLSLADFFPTKSWPLIAVSLGGSAVIVAAQLLSGDDARQSWRTVAALTVFALALLSMVWRHPAVRDLRLRLRPAQPEAA
jgi:O-antigen/teichoic acid export membrane protein